MDYEWISGNRILSVEEMKHNALITYEYLSKRGWTLNAISGVLGNMQAESSINPAIWEGLKINPKRGFGLVQWTPSTNFTNWAYVNNYLNEDGFAQLKWINEITSKIGQWIKTPNYPISFEDFKKSTDKSEHLADCFLKNFERPANINQPTRQAYARFWFNYLNTYNKEETNSKYKWFIIK